MSPEVVQAVIATAGLLLSLGGALYVAGRKSQAVDDHERRIMALEQLPGQVTKIESAMSAISHDLAEIKGMFKLTLKEPG